MSRRRGEFVVALCSGAIRFDHLERQLFIVVSVDLGGMHRYNYLNQVGLFESSSKFLLKVSSCNLLCLSRLYSMEFGLD